MLERIFSADTFWWILMVLYVPACIGLIVIVLLQKGKGTSFAGATSKAPCSVSTASRVSSVYSSLTSTPRIGSAKLARRPLGIAV